MIVLHFPFSLRFSLLNLSSLPISFPSPSHHILHPQFLRISTVLYHQSIRNSFASTQLFIRKSNNQENMHFSTIALIASMAAIVAASPHPPFTEGVRATPVVAARACYTIYPSTIQALSSTDPDNTFDNTAPAHFAGNSIIKLSQNQTSGKP